MATAEMRGRWIVWTTLDSVLMILLGLAALGPSEGCKMTDEAGRQQDNGGGSEVAPGGGGTKWADRAGPGPKRTMKPLTAEEKRIIRDKGTEQPFSGKYCDHSERGAYACRQCGAVLYLSDSKFHSKCGWPSFDDEVPGAVKRTPDADGRRTEILCKACGGHLGHVFLGEGYTEKNTRHCVNSVSLVFIPASERPLRKAVFAGGCFWGVEHHFQQVPGVISAVSGYTGGKAGKPTYEQVCTGKTGHAEAVEVVFDPARVSYEDLARLFFEIHDPTQVNRQEPDVGTQYRSAVFCVDDEQKRTAEKLIARLRAKGYEVATALLPASKFWPAEAYHQDYIHKHPSRKCHPRVTRFGPFDGGAKD